VERGGRRQRSLPSKGFGTGLRRRIACRVGTAHRKDCYRFLVGVAHPTLKYIELA